MVGAQALLVERRLEAPAECCFKLAMNENNSMSAARPCTGVTVAAEG